MQVPMRVSLSATSWSHSTAFASAASSSCAFRGASPPSRRSASSIGDAVQHWRLACHVWAFASTGLHRTLCTKPDGWSAPLFESLLDTGRSQVPRDCGRPSGRDCWKPQHAAVLLPHRPSSGCTREWLASSPLRLQTLARKGRGKLARLSLTLPSLWKRPANGAAYSYSPHRPR